MGKASEPLKNRFFSKINIDNLLIYGGCKRFECGFSGFP